jgi:hypothetical protein
MRKRTGSGRELVRLGRIVATRNALAHLTPYDIMEGLARHKRGDWGEVCRADKGANRAALKDGERLLSAYRSADGTKFWIITEADRSATTVLLPEDY